MRKILFTVPTLVLLLVLSPGAKAQGDFVTGPLTAQATACPTNPGKSVSTSAITISTINVGGATFTIGSTAFSATVAFFASGDGGTTWQGLNVFPSSSTTPVTGANAAGLWQANVAGYTHVCMLVSAFTSGTVTATIRTSTVSARVGGGGGVAPGGAGTVVGGTGGGTAQAQTLTPSPAITSLVAGGSVIYCWQPIASNSGPGTTLNISGLGAKTITKGPSGVLALITNDIFLGATACAVYDGTEFQLQNPQAGIGALTSTTVYGPAAQALNLYTSGGCTNGPPPSCTGNFVGFLAPPSVTASLQFLLPTADATTAGQPLVSDAAQHLSFAQKVNGSCAPVGSATPVTSTNPTINTDQNLIQLSIPAGCLNTLAQVFDIKAGGIYSSTAASSPALTFKAKLCTISGCGSGTVVPLFNIVTTALNTTALTNATYNLIGNCVTATTGATGNLICHGAPGLTLDTGATLTTPDTVFADTNTAVSSPNIDLTAALFLQFTIAQSVVGGSNSYTQQLAAIR